MLTKITMTMDALFYHVKIEIKFIMKSCDTDKLHTMQDVSKQYTFQCFLFKIDNVSENDINSYVILK